MGEILRRLFRDKSACSFASYFGDLQPARLCTCCGSFRSLNEGFTCQVKTFNLMECPRFFNPSCLEVEKWAEMALLVRDQTLHEGMKVPSAVDWFEHGLKSVKSSRAVIVMLLTLWPSLTLIDLDRPSPKACKFSRFVKHIKGFFAAYVAVAFLGISVSCFLFIVQNVLKTKHQTTLWADGVPEGHTSYVLS